MQTLCGIVATVMAAGWILWVALTVINLIDPTDMRGWAGWAILTAIIFPVIYGGFRLLESQQRR